MNDDDFSELLIDKIAGELSSTWNAQVSKYVDSSGLDLPYSKKELVGILEWVIHNWVLMLENTNWYRIRQQGGNFAVSRELRKITEGLAESGLYWVEKSFGYDEGGPRPRTAGERMAEKMLEAFRRSDDEFFGQLGQLRQVEFLKTKRITRKLIQDIEIWIKLQITRYGGGK